jgi:hypothetical protein
VDGPGFLGGQLSILHSTRKTDNISGTSSQSKKTIYKEICIEIQSVAKGLAHGHSRALLLACGSSSLSGHNVDSRRKTTLITIRKFIYWDSQIQLDERSSQGVGRIEFISMIEK